MYFIDLEHLKIVKSYNFETHSVNIPLNINANLKDVLEVFQKGAAELVANKPAIECCYVMNCGEGVATDEEAEVFLNIVNVALSAFFRAFTLKGGRKRERRLDVPKKLQVSHCSLSLLKEAINHPTVVDRFNFMIQYKDLVYILCDEKEIKEEQLDA